MAVPESKKPELPPRPVRSLLLPALALLGALALARLISAGASGQRIPYSEFKAAVAAGRVEEVVVGASTVEGRYKAEAASAATPSPAPNPLLKKDARSFDALRVEDKDLLHDLEAHGVRVSGVPDSSWTRDALGWLLPLGLLGVAWYYMLRRSAGGMLGGAMTVGRSKAKVYVEKEVGVRFTDVAGVDEAKEELREVIEFLRTPEKFRRLGGKIPKGILLVGPPGTGKTLLARAVAGEAAVPFFSISGSEFVEMFVGVGAARVRDLFAEASGRAPCIIFIDELDALGKARGLGGMPGAHEEREQTLNQLLVEMDGFDPRTGVILMAATNRPEILDPALLRSGRFDRHVLVDRPDRKGRLEILKVHARGVALAKDADLDAIAAMTVGLVGADLANIVNEAALLGVRRGLDAIGSSELQEAVERVLTGLEKRNRVLSPAERERVAHHEVGHALMALAVGRDPVRKISIIPRGIAALGYTLQLPTEDRFLMTQPELEDRIAILLGGRVAEELTLGSPSTGAQDDLVKATDIARSMVRSYGMSPRLGPVSFEREQRSMFDVPRTEEHSEEVERAIDAEVRRIIDEQRDRAATHLGGCTELLRAVAAELLRKETLSGDQLAALVATGNAGARAAAS